MKGMKESSRVLIIGASMLGLGFAGLFCPWVKEGSTLAKIVVAMLPIGFGVGFVGGIMWLIDYSKRER